MATSLGKKKIRVEIFVDNESKGSSIDFKVVYALKNGTYQVNYLKGRREVLPLGEIFYQRIDIQSIRKICPGPSFPRLR